MVTSNPDPARLESLGVSSWPTWGCGLSTFPWSYDEQETCLLLEENVTVTPNGARQSDDHAAAFPTNTASPHTPREH